MEIQLFAYYVAKNGIPSYEAGFNSCINAFDYASEQARAHQTDFVIMQLVARPQRLVLYDIIRPEGG